MPTEIYGTLFDGQSARGLEAILTISDEMLVIAPTDSSAGAPTFSWPVKKVELAELPAPGAPVRLRCRTAPGVVFSVADEASIAELTRLLPNLLDKSRRHRKRVTFSIVALGVSALVVLGVYFGWPQIARNVAGEIPLEWEERLGESALSQMETVAGETCTNVKDRPGLNALAGLAGRLSKGRGLPHSISVHVVDWSHKNAFALPGGHVVFTSGIIEFMEEPDELAGVLAHEIGHVEGRHVMISLVQNWGLNLFLSVVFGGGGGASDMSYLLLSSRYSRELEGEADRVGLEMLEQADIDSRGFARLFERFEAEAKQKKYSSGLSLPDFLRTHPAHASRIEMAKAGKEGDSPALTEAEWASVKSICDD